MRALAAVVLVALGLSYLTAAPQGEVTDADLERADGGRVVAIGSPSGERPASPVPLETYVARVLAGEAEQDAPDGELQALAIAIRTYATFNAGRHARDGFDLCDTTHCQVMRTATAATRRAALATAGEILTWNGAAAEIFYSASCGGRSESAAAVWPGADLPYLRSVKDDVHDDDQRWSFDLGLVELQRLLARRGFAGDRLTDVRIASRTSSGRVGSLRLSGLEPDVIAGDQFRLLVGARDVRSTAFDLERHGGVLHFTGRGYGHGVGMCVIGAGRRARRGESVRQILSQYYPGLEVRHLDTMPARFRSGALIAVERASTIPPPVGAGPAAAPIVAPRPTAPGPAAPAADAVPTPVTVRGAAEGAPQLQRIALRAHEALSRALGVTASSVTIDVHATVERFRQATGKPWWASASVNGGVIDLAPPSLLQQRDGIDVALRRALAQFLMAPEFAGRPMWVAVGAARYFASLAPVRTPDPKTKVKCPADAELTLAISAAAQRDADARAEACFARAYARTHDWRTVR